MYIFVFVFKLLDKQLSVVSDVLGVGAMCPFVESLTSLICVCAKNNTDEKYIKIA